MKTLLLVSVAFLSNPLSPSAAPPGDPSTGILYDRVVPLSGIELYDGRPGSPPVGLGHWRQMVFELRRASTVDPAWPSPRQLRETPSGQPIPIGILNVEYERTGEDRLLRRHRVYAVAPLDDVTYRGGEVRFRLDPDFYLTNDERLPVSMSVDLGDGSGPRAARFGESLTASYERPGPKTIRLRMTFDDGSELESRASFHVAQLETPDPDDTLTVTATLPFEGSTADGRAYVYLAEANDSLRNPVVLIEGFDIENDMDWDVLYDLLNREELLETLRADGFDAVVLDFTDATDYIQRNSFVVTALIERIQSMIEPDKEFPLVGASLGGLACRYALSYMEQNGLDHRVSTFLSFDAPHTGANIPLGMQYWLDFFSGQSADAAFLLSRLDRPAARQLLVYHHTDPPGATGEPDPLRTEFLADLAAVGSYPVDLRKVAVANGSGMGMSQGFSPGAQVIDYSYQSFLIDLTGDVWAVSDGADQLIFDGVINPFLLPATTLAVTVGGTRPYDSAPGGYRGSFVQMDTTEAPYGDIIALHENHCFIPTVSALDLNTDDLLYDIAGDPDLLAQTPFDAVYYPSSNEEHVLVTVQNKEWFLGEIRGPLVAVGETPGALSAGLRLLPSYPNPFDSGTRIRFVLPEPGKVRLSIHDVRGRLVATLIDGNSTAGEQDVTWDGRGDAGHQVRSGIYFSRLESEGAVVTRKLVRLQ